MFGKLILSIDKLGGSYNLKYQGYTRYRTYFGGFLTLFSIIIFLIFFFLIGIDFYLRINPHVTMSKTLENEYFNYTLNPSNFLFAFRIEARGKILLRPDLFFIEPHYIVFNQTETGMKKIVDEIVPYHRCEFNDANYNKVYNTSVMSQFLCLDKPKDSEGYIGGGLYDAKYIKYFKIKFNHCSVGQDYNIKNNITCNSNLTEFENVFKSSNSLYVKYMIQSYYVDSADYYDPFKLSFDSMYQTMEMNTQKKVYFYFKKGVLNDNKGWLLDETNLIDYIGLDRQRLDFKDGNSDITENVFYEINLYFDRIVENYIRRYQKIQDVLAGVGGLIKIITFFFGFIVSYYNEHYQYLNFMNNILLKNIVNKNEISSRRKQDFSVNKINNKLNPNSNINSKNNNADNYNSNSMLDLNKTPNNQILDNSNCLSNANQENKETVLFNQKSVNPDSKFKKFRSVSVFRKINRDKGNNSNISHIRNVNNITNNFKNQQNDLVYAKPIEKVSLSFMKYLVQFFFKKMRNKDENYLNFIKFADIIDKHLDISKLLEFFTKYEPLMDQLAMSCDQNFSNNTIINN